MSNATEEEEWPLVSDEELMGNAEDSSESSDADDHSKDAEESPENPTIFGSEDLGRAVNAYMLYAIFYPLFHGVWALIPGMSPSSNVVEVYIFGAQIAIAFFITYKIIRLIRKIRGN